MTAAVLGLILAAGVVAPPAPKAVPVYTIPRGEVPRDVSSAPKITTLPATKPEG
jgi:hypothetical protein